MNRRTIRDEQQLILKSLGREEADPALLGYTTTVNARGRWFWKRIEVINIRYGNKSIAKSIWIPY